MQKAPAEAGAFHYFYDYRVARVTVLLAKFPTADEEIVLPETPTDAVWKPPVAKVPIVAPTTEDDTLPELS